MMIIWLICCVINIMPSSNGQQINEFEHLGDPVFKQNSGNYKYRTSEFRNTYKMLREMSSILDLSKDIVKTHSAAYNQRTNQVGSRNVDTCSKDMFGILTAVSQNQLWAYQMIDAIGKPGPDILRGNFKWVGGFDECKRIKPVQYVFKDNQTIPNHWFGTQYCMVTMTTDPPLQLPMTGMTTGLTVQSGFCLPDSCTNEDALNILNLIFSLRKVGNYSFKATSVDCHHSYEVDSTAIAAIVILGIIAFLVITGTLIDFYHKFWPMFMPSLPRKELPPKITETSFGYSQDTSPLLNDDKKTEEREPGTLAKLFISFSVYSNGKKLLNTSQSADSLTAVNGMRFLSISWVVLCHAYGFVESSARNVRSVTADFLPRWTFQAIANAYVSVDSFFALSGLLLAYLTMKELEKKGSVRNFNWPMFYFHRFWRLTPPYMLIMLADMALLRYVGEGPYWKYEGPNTDTDNCKETWWWNLLYINNFQLDKSCFGHAWYLANDMQFFVLSPLMLIPLFYNGVVGLCVCFLFLLATCITTGVISSHYDLPPTTFSSKNSEEYGRYLYVKPWCRIGPYIVGIIFGYLLHKMKGRIRLNKVINLSIWTIVAALAIVILYGLRDYIKDFTTLDDSMETAVAALYNATHRTLWGVCVCWVIFACATGHGGFVNTLLSWEGFVPLARLSYCVYLVHIFVLYAYIMDRRLPIYLDDLTGIYIFLGGLVLSNLVAFVCSLMFEAPMLGLEKIIFKRGKQK